MSTDLAELLIDGAFALVEHVVEFKAVSHQGFGIFKDLQLAFELGFFAGLGVQKADFLELERTQGIFCDQCIALATQLVETGRVSPLLAPVARDLMPVVVEAAIGIEEAAV